MIELTAKTTKNVKVNFYYDNECFISYTIATSQTPGVYTGIESQYQVYTMPRYNKDNSKLVTRTYAKYVQMIKLTSKSFLEMQREINKAYFTMKRAAMIDARKSKLVDLVVKNSKRVRTISKLQKEIELLEAIEPGKEFGHYILTPQYQYETEQIEKEKKRLESIEMPF